MDDVLVSWESLEPYCTDLWRHILREKGCVFSGFYWSSWTSCGFRAMCLDGLVNHTRCYLGVPKLRWCVRDVRGCVAGLALVQLSVPVPRPCSSMFDFQFPALEGPKSQDLRVWIEQPMFFSHHLMPDDPWIRPEVPLDFTFFGGGLVLMSQKVIALIHHASSGHWIPIFCWSSCFARRTLHWNQPWTVQMAVGEWSPWAPSNRHGMSWFMLFHAGVFTYFYIQTLFLVDSCVAWMALKVVFHAQPTPVSIANEVVICNSAISTCEKASLFLGHLKDILRTDLGMGITRQQTVRLVESGWFQRPFNLGPRKNHALCAFCFIYLTVPPGYLTVCHGKIHPFWIGKPLSMGHFPWLCQITRGNWGLRDIENNALVSYFYSRGSYGFRGECYISYGQFPCKMPMLCP